MKYKTKVMDIGESSKDMTEQNMIILFGENAPDELKPFCHLININDIEGEIEDGDRLFISGDEYHIETVGDLVNQNLANLGHVTLNFGEANTQDNILPGTIYIKETLSTVLSITDSIYIK